MKKISFLKLLLLSSSFSFAQSVKTDTGEVARIERTLAADDMQGRKPFTAGIDKAAGFIAAEFKKAGLQFLPELTDYKQPFSLVRTKFISATGSINGNIIEQNNIIAITTEAALKINEQSGYKIIILDSTSKLSVDAVKLLQDQKNYLVIVNNFHAANFSRLKRFKRDIFKRDYNVIFVLTDAVPVNYNFEIVHEISSSSLSNVVGVLPGRSKKDEYVVFSGHYDHLGIGKPNAAMDSIYNGANDDASGTTAVIMLANYFSKLKNNERTIIFTTFTAEEIGGYGSQYFSSQLDPDKVVAMFNIEMIGTESKWGTNSAYITGYEKSDFGKILQNNLAGTNFNFEPDPYPQQNLFYRSDNATLAALGVPAHTISTSKMDSEKFYHTQEDEIQTLDMANMSEIIRAIALSSQTIINGKDTPTRVVKSE
ncbi:hypothetical protein BH11BAC4_BH11BAC4_04800 [soil metagenome]